MSNIPNRDDQHFQELLAGKVLGDLSAEEVQEFGELFSATHSKDLQYLESAAAALQLALSDDSKTLLPESLRQRIVDASDGFDFTNAAQFNLNSDGSRVGLPALQNRDSDRIKFEQRQSKRFTWREGIAWLAAAASLFIVARLWLAGDLPNPFLTPPTAVESRLAMLNETPDLIRVDWADGKTPFGNSVKGDVVWSNASQKGFMRFVGMPANNPSQEQYQLWIIDPDRDTEPIDGGVFDIPSGAVSSGEVVIPIQAKLKVLKPSAFAVTIEQPGGVVVSTQNRLPLIAKVAN